MAKLAKNQWELQGWTRGEQLKDKEGNQGHAFLARKDADPHDEYNYILKTLKRQTEPARRAMFFNETSAMSTLEHAGVLQVEATNAQDYKRDVELYLITRLLKGPDLEDLVEQGLPFENAIELTLGVLTEKGTEKGDAAHYFAFMVILLCYTGAMPRRPRKCPAGMCFHVLNRAVARLTLFEKPED